MRQRLFAFVSPTAQPLSLSLLWCFRILYTPAVLSHIENFQPHFIYTTKQNVFFRWFLLRKNTFRCSPPPEVGGCEGLNKYSLTLCGLYYPCLSSLTHCENKKYIYITDSCGKSQMWNFNTKCFRRMNKYGQIWGLNARIDYVLWKVASSL